MSGHRRLPPAPKHGRMRELVQAHALQEKGSGVCTGPIHAAKGLAALVGTRHASLFVRALRREQPWKRESGRANIVGHNTHTVGFSGTAHGLNTSQCTRIPPPGYIGQVLINAPRYTPQKKYPGSNTLHSQLSSAHRVVRSHLEGFFTVRPSTTAKESRAVHEGVAAQ